VGGVGRLISSQRRLLVGGPAPPQTPAFTETSIPQDLDLHHAQGTLSSSFFPFPLGCQHLTYSHLLSILFSFNLAAVLIVV
jgi:hypothetical protein